MDPPESKWIGIGVWERGSERMYADRNLDYVVFYNGLVSVLGIQL